MPRQSTASVRPEFAPVVKASSYVKPKAPAPLALPHRKIEPSYFQLPGEAFAERQRLKKEQRMKRLEEEEKEARAFKSRPVFYTFLMVVGGKFLTRAKKSLRPRYRNV